MQISFGRIGVFVEDYTKESLYALLKDHGLENLIDGHYLEASEPFAENMYLQSKYAGSYTEGTTIAVYAGFIRSVTDMENFLLILRVGILDPDAANDLIEELYLQELIKPRNSHETN